MKNQNIQFMNKFIRFVSKIINKKLTGGLYGNHS